MPTPTFRIAALTLLLASAHAATQAQDVNIYGIVDVYGAIVKSGSATTRMVADGGNYASRLGFRGKEDLGDGLSANFTLELGLGLDDGSIALGGGFGRQAFVGLSGPAGSVNLGRQYTPLFWNLLATATFGMNVNWAPVQMVTRTDGQGAAVVGLAPPLRQNNMVGYSYGSLNKPGVRFEVAAAPGEDAATSGRFEGGAISYRGSNYFVGYATQKLRSGTSAAVPFWTRTQAVSGSFALGALAFNANYIATDANATAARKATLSVLGTSYTTGPHVWLAEVARRSVAGIDRGANVITLGYDHNLSKRTTLYARLLTLNNNGQAANSMALATVAANSGDDVRALALGIRHSF